MGHADLSALRLVVSGGASAPVETIRAWRAAAPGRAGRAPPRVGIIDILGDEQFERRGIVQHETGIARLPFIAKRGVVTPGAEKFTAGFGPVVVDGAAGLVIEMRAPIVIPLAGLLDGKHLAAQVTIAAGAAFMQMA
jgi:hypothetical protein